VGGVGDRHNGCTVFDWAWTGVGWGHKGGDVVRMQGDGVESALHDGRASLCEGRTTSLKGVNSSLQHVVQQQTLAVCVKWSFVWQRALRAAGPLGCCAALSTESALPAVVVLVCSPRALHTHHDLTMHYVDTNGVS
jgi:hypothetical protein